MTDPVAMAVALIEDCVSTQRRLTEPDCLQAIVNASGVLLRSLSQGGKLLIFGNGGSASDAAHVAAEFVGRFQAERRGLPALSLSANESTLTSIANDFGFEHVFARQLEAIGTPGDVAIAISTSGRSTNVIAGARTARRLGLATVGLTGADGGELRDLVDVCVSVPASRTARVQESHILIAHVLCEIVERKLS